MTPQTGPARQAGASARPGRPAGFTFTVDPWDPAYGMAFGEELDGGSLQASAAELNLDLELPADQWRPVDPDLTAALPAKVLFLDGVRRIDARVWVHGNGPQPVPGIAASIAAGLVRCDGAAHITEVRAERGLFSPAAHAVDIGTRYAVYPARIAGGPGPDKLSLALQQRLADAEVELATAARDRAADDLLVVDGPLRGRTHLDSHRRLRQDPSCRLPASRPGRRDRRAASGAAQPGVHDGHLVAAQFLVSPAARRAGRPVGRGGPA